jgi:hypothetical protein
VHVSVPSDTVNGHGPSVHVTAEMRSSNGRRDGAIGWVALAGKLDSGPLTTVPDKPATTVAGTPHPVAELTDAAAVTATQIRHLHLGGDPDITGMKIRGGNVRA